MEEVIKIQSSYKIIKNHNVKTDDESTLILDGNVNLNKNISFVESEPDKENYDELIDLDDFRDEIRDSLIEEIREKVYTETAKERLKIIESAKEEAKILIQEANNQGFKKGLEEGFNKGYHQGIEDAKSEAMKIKDNAIKVLQDSNAYIHGFYKKSHDDIVKLAADMAEAIVHHTINEASENIMMLIRPLLYEFSKSENIIISCHPDNIDHLKLQLFKLEEICPNATFTILEDSNLEVNGCIVENDNQIIDLQIKKQIYSILETIRDINYTE